MKIKTHISHLKYDQNVFQPWNDLKSPPPSLTSLMIYNERNVRYVFLFRRPKHEEQ